MKDINLYKINVSTRGPVVFQHKNGYGSYIIVAKSENQAKEYLQNYFKANNLFGDMYQPCKYSLDNVLQLELGTVMRKKEYLTKLEEYNNKREYQFTPKKTEKGNKLHKINRPGIEYRERNVQGAYGNERSCTFNPDKPEMFEDCLDLHNIDGITFEGKPLNYENMSDETIDKTFENFITDFNGKDDIEKEL